MGRVAKTVVFALLMLLSGSAAAAPAPTDGGSPAGEDANCDTAATVAQAAQQICGSTPTGEALLSARLEPATADNIAQLLAGLGFQTALDLRLLGGGPEAEELMGELQADGRLNIGDRAKVRLLIGNRAHLRRLGAAPPQGHGKMRWVDAAVPGQ